MGSTWLVLVLTGIAAITDLRFGKIYNWITYPGIVLGVLVSSFEPGGIGWEDSLIGLFGCGLLMVLAFLLFDVSGGDVKLVAMMASWLGWRSGLAALLWTCILGAALALMLLVWRMGLITLIRMMARQIWGLIRLGQWLPVSEAEQRELKAPLMLGPAAFLGVVFVRILNWQ